jgi:hypothetical protein
MLEEVVRVIASFSRVFFFPHTKKKTLKSEHETKEIGVTIKTIVFRLNDNEGRVLAPEVFRESKRFRGKIHGG